MKYFEKNFVAVQEALLHLLENTKLPTLAPIIIQIATRGFLCLIVSIWGNS